MTKKLNNKINWPALSTVLFNVVPDSTFNIGSGITTITPNLVSLLWGMSADSYEANRIPYPEKTVVNPHMGLNTIIYNPNTNNRDAVSLDALHVMHDSPIYLELYKQYVESLPQGFEPLMEAANDEFGNLGVTIIEKYLKGLPLSLEEQEVIEPIYDALLRRQFAPDYMRNVHHGYQDKAILPIIPSINMSGDEAIRRYMESYPLKEITITPENKHGDGGPLHPDWSELSMKERAAYIRMGVASGYKDIDSIKLVYNEFRNGGNTLNPPLKYIYDELPRLLRKAGLDVKVSSGYRRAGTVGTAGDRSWHPKHGAVDIVPLGNTTFEDIEYALHNNPVIRQYMLANNFGLLDESGRTPESRATMLRTGATGPHFHIGKDSKPAAMYRLRVGALQQTDGNKVVYFNNPFMPIPLDNVLINTPIVLEIIPSLVLELRLVEQLPIAFEGTIPEVVVTPNRPRYIIPDEEILSLILGLIKPYTPIEVPKSLTATERLKLLNDNRVTLLLKDLEDSIIRNNLLGIQNPDKLRRDAEDLRFYRNMSAYGGNLFDGTSQPTLQMNIAPFWDSQKPFYEELDEFNRQRELERQAQKEAVRTGKSQTQAIADKRAKDYLTTSNDAIYNTTVSKNSHLHDRAIEGSKAHAAWEKEHPNLTAWGNILGAAPFAVASIPAVATVGSGIAALGDAAAATSVGLGITNFLTPLATTSVAGATVPQWVDLGLTSGFGTHGIQTAIDEKGISPMTALEVAPLGRLATPMWNAGKETIYNIADRYIFMPHQNSFTRGIGITDAGLQDAINTGVFRGNPRGTEYTAKQFTKGDKWNRDHFKDIMNETGIDDIASKFQSRTLSEEEFNAIKEASKKYVTSRMELVQDNSGKLGYRTIEIPADPLEPYPNYASYKDDIAKTIAEVEKMPYRVQSGEVKVNNKLTPTVNGIPHGKPIEERFGPNSDYVVDGHPMSYWYPDGRNPIARGHAYAKSNYGVRVNNPEDYLPFMHELHLHPSFFRSPKFADPNVEIFGKGPLGITVKLDKETLQPVWKRDLSNMFRRGETIRTPQIAAENAAGIQLENANSVAKYPELNRFFTSNDTPAGVVSDIEALISLELLKANIGLFDRLFNKEKAELARLARLKIMELLEDLGVAKLRVNAAAEEYNTNFMDERLNNYTGEQLWIMGIDKDKPISVYTDMQDFLNRAKTLLGHDLKLTTLRDAIHEYSLIEKKLELSDRFTIDELEALQKLSEATMAKMDSVADELEKLGVSDSELLTFANLTYHGADNRLNLMDAAALEDTGVIIAPSPKDPRYKWVVNHERNHVLQDAAKAFASYRKKFGLLTDTGFNLSSEYLKTLTELLARGTLIKDFFGLKKDLDITAAMLKYAAKHYSSLTHLNNNMTEFFNGITDYEKAAKWLSYAAALGIPMSVALNYISEGNDGQKSSF